ncbi:methyltransferase domain-containing protein [Paenibacillus sp. HB172176]|uniref:class I SAM-dependent methyltransferase n=1 Tax=Paenibacillus sp. HB172176 TaxID=2493690 RepID=UPI0014391858|nr:methyltransferase domain-containing protein [Paenibacillus sp. HB172176]
MASSRYEQIGVAMTCRSFDEYCKMFDLLEEDLDRGKILDVAGGSSSFVAEARRRGYEASAADPRYEGDIANWIREASDEIETSTNKLDALQEHFDWSYYGSIHHHRAGRERSLGLFADHVNDCDGRLCYQGGRLPQLPYEDDSFSLVLCSHFLFLYADQFDFDFHLDAVSELMRVCKPGGQIRIYPLLSLGWKPYPQLEELIEHIRASDAEATLMPSKLPFIPGSQSYLRINRLINP